MSIPFSAGEYYLPKAGSIDDLTLRTKQVELPKANEVLVKVHAVSLQYRDLMAATGTYPIKKDLVPGSDVAGEIVSLGEYVKGWKVGDRVSANFSPNHIYGDPTAATLGEGLGGHVDGVLTEYRTFPESALVAIPQHLTYEEASTLPCAAVTAYNALNGPKAVKAGDHILVLGTGGVSTFGLQFAVAAGATVIATSSSDEKLKIASKLGAKHVVNYKTHPNWEEKVLEITNGAGVDHVIEIGGPGSLPKSLACTRIGGHIHLVGASFTEEQGSGNLMRLIIRRGATVRGIQTGSLAQFVDMNKMLAAHPDKRPYIDRVFSFDELKEAYRYLKSGAHVGKVVVKVAKE